MTDNNSIQALVRKIESERGYINLLINNAGAIKTVLPRPLPSDIKELQAGLWNSGTPDDFDDALKLNLRAPYYVTIAFLHLLHEGNKHGIPRGITSQVIHNASIEGLRRDESLYSFSYTTSKAALIHLGKTFTNILNPHQIRSNVVCFGWVPSGNGIGA